MVKLNYYMRYFVFILFFLFSCEKEDINGYTTFKIKKDSHKSNYSLRFTNKNNLIFLVQFDSSAIYKTVSPVNQWDVNKLIGVSDGGFHGANSARFGWRYVDGNLELLGYTHYKGKFNFEKIKNIKIGEVYTLNLLINEKYMFIVDKDTVIMDRYPNYYSKSYYLWPYFGGDEVAPHDITIKIKY